MGIRDVLFGVKSNPLEPLVRPISYETVNPAPLVTVTSNGIEVHVDLGALMSASPAALFRTQPYLRSVVSFLARNIAQLGLFTYQRVGEERMRDRTSVTAQLIASPNDTTTRYELINALISDLALWDTAFWLVTPDSKRKCGWRITQIPVAWVDTPFGGDLWEPETWRITRPGKPTFEVSAKNVLHFHGWDPEYVHRGTSPVQTLKMILLEQIASVIYRQQRWERGARVGTVITRPATAPQWSREAEERFRKEWRNSYQSAEGTDAGGTPILQDGMTLTKLGFSAVEDEFVAASKLALATVASVYHVNPTMVGLLDNANYSNVREFRRMLYGDTLGPWLSFIEDRLNGFLLPKIGAADNEYVEFNIGEKLQGSFEEQAAVASMAVGGPYMTRNEMRALQNLPPIDGADELIVPLNVTTGGQPSPMTPVLSQMPLRLAAPDRPGTTNGRGVGTSQRRTKARASERHTARAEGVLKSFYRRQSRVVLSALGSKSAASWWDTERWNKELSADLFALAMQVSTELGLAASVEMGALDPYDAEATKEYLLEVMATRAELINDTTRQQIEDALSAVDDPEAPTPADVFTEAETIRAVSGAVSLMTAVSGIAMMMAGQQASPEATKTWHVNSKNPRPAHAAMNGQTVGIDENFSNGAAWPGDNVLGPDGIAGCECDIIVRIP